MDLYRIRTALWLGSLAMACALVGIAAWGIFSPVDVVAMTDGAGTGRSAASEDSRVKDRPLLEHYAVVWQRDLRKPLFDPPPVVAQKTPPPKPKLTLRLVGTAVEEGASYAMFATADGGILLCRTGQKAEGAEVKSIAVGAATILFNGETITLEVEKDRGEH